MPQTTTPPLEDYNLADGRGATQRITAQKLGEGSSYQPGKTRWFEVNLYREGDGGFIVHTIGQTIYDDEITRVRIVRTHSAFEVVELLTVTHRGETYIPRASARAIAQAASHDDALRDAYINRAV